MSLIDLQQAEKDCLIALNDFLLSMQLPSLASEKGQTEQLMIQKKFLELVAQINRSIENI